MTSNWLLRQTHSRIAVASSWIKQRKCNQVFLSGSTKHFLSHSAPSHNTGEAFQQLLFHCIGIVWPLDVVVLHVRDNKQRWFRLVLFTAAVSGLRAGISVILQVLGSLFRRRCWVMKKFIWCPSWYILYKYVSSKHLHESTKFPKWSVRYLEIASRLCV